jgi:hypothetical protein
MIMAHGRMHFADFLQQHKVVLRLLPASVSSMLRSIQYTSCASAAAAFVQAIPPWTLCSSPHAICS